MTTLELIEFRQSKSPRWSRAYCAMRLGCSERAITNWENGRPIPMYIAMACAAVEANLKPYGSDTE